MIIINLHPIIKEIIEDRGLDVDELTDLNINNLPKPNLIPNIDKFKERINTAIEWNDKVCVYGDYDFDGASSSAILYKTLKQLGVNVISLISTRQRDGYGLSKKAVDKMNDNSVDLIITTDCGITADKEIEYAQSLGMGVFVLDHHNRYNEPDFDYIDLHVNQGMFPTNKLSCGGLAYFISKYLIGSKADKYLDLAGFSTIADLVDMTDKTNRILANQGMNNIQNEGIKALMEVKSVDKVDSETIGFSLAPCINAGGRLTDNKISFELFTTEDKNKRYNLAEKLNKINEKRKKMTENIVENIENNAKLDENIIVYQGDVPKGITGLAAGKLSNKHNKPAIIVNKEGKGSGRSLPPLNLQSELQEHLDIIEYASGHDFAFGVGIGDNDISLLQNRLYKEFEDIEYDTIDYEKEVQTGVIDDYFMESLCKLKPFGQSFKRPKLKVKISDIENLHLVGGKYPKFFINNTECISWTHSKEEIRQANELVVSPNYNEFMGNKSIQLTVKDVIK